jgi:hypothetical protein
MFPRAAALTGSRDGLLTTGRGSWVASHQCVAFWFIFWDDVWTNIKDVPALASHAGVFDPHWPASLPYTPLARPELEAKLSALGLTHANKMFSPAVLEAVYARIAALQATVAQDPPV